MSSLESINRNNLPKHIGIIMDGNGRWAKKQGQFRLYGHSHGVQSVRNCAEACAELGIEYLTLYAFSTENWNRPESEINGLMELLVSTIHSETDTLNKNNIRLRAIGNISELPESCQKELSEAVEKTKNNTRLTLILALSYSSRWEITEAARKISVDVKAGKLEENNINEDTLNKYLCTSDYPDPELLIRTSGEHRISNFLLWQIAYAELYFTEVLWPDFRKEDLYDAILNFQNRERRFGKISEQINPL